MIRFRLDDSPHHQAGLLRRRDLDGPRHDRMVVQRPPLMGEDPRAIEAVFHEHVGRLDRGLDLVQLPVVRHRPIPP